MLKQHKSETPSVSNTHKVSIGQIKKHLLHVSDISLL